MKAAVRWRNNGRGSRGHLVATGITACRIAAVARRGVEAAARGARTTYERPCRGSHNSSSGGPRCWPPLLLLASVARRLRVGARPQLRGLVAVSSGQRQAAGKAETATLRMSPRASSRSARSSCSNSSRCARSSNSRRSSASGSRPWRTRRGAHCRRLSRYGTFPGHHLLRRQGRQALGLLTRRIRRARASSCE